MSGWTRGFCTACTSSMVRQGVYIQCWPFAISTSKPAVTCGVGFWSAIIWLAANFSKDLAGRRQLMRTRARSARLIGTLNSRLAASQVASGRASSVATMVKGLALGQLATAL